MKKNRVPIFIVCLVLPLLIALLSAWIAGDLRAEYAGLALPPLSPPGWLFGIVWPVLYILMGIALFLMIDASIPSGEKMLPVLLFCIQLALNFAWSPIFFRANMLWVAFAIIILLDAALVACMISFFKVKKVAGALLVPYGLWLLFATYLNLACAILN